MAGIDNALLFNLLAAGLVVSALSFAAAYMLFAPRAKRRAAEAQTAQAIIAELQADNNRLQSQLAVLNERLDGQRQHYEAQLQSLKESKESLSKEFENLANRIFDAKQASFNVQSKQLIDTTLDPLRRELVDFRKKVEDAYDKENAERNKLMGQVSELQKQAQQISSDAVALANALKGESKAQGNWGEFILEKLLEDSGLTKGIHYDTQSSFQDDEGGRKQPDVIVHLPEGRDIVVDSKVSLVHYERYFHAEQDDKEQHLKQHLLSLRNHIRGLNLKQYEKLHNLNSLDFVLLFVPVEGAFMLAVNNDAELFSDAYNRNIILVSPSTLLATLRTIRNIWQFADQNANAQKIADKAGSLHDQFALVLESFDDIGKHIEKSAEAWQTARKRLSDGRGNMVNRVDELAKLGAKNKKSLPTAYLDNSIDPAESD